MENKFKIGDIVHLNSNKETTIDNWDGSVLELLKQFKLEMINPKSKTIIPSLNDAIRHIVKGNN